MFAGAVAGDYRGPCAEIIAMLDKTEWPNEAKLKSLREAGIVPLGLFSCRCVWTVVFLCTLWSLRMKFSVLGQSALGSVEGQLSAGRLLALAAEAARLGALPLISASVVTIVWALFQTKFLFRMSLAAPTFERLAHFGFPNPLSASSRIFAALVQLLVIIGCGLLCMRLCWTGVLYLLNNDRLYIVAWFPAVLQAALAPICILLSISALLGWMSAKGLYLLRHRMSREEMERGYVESDVTRVS